MRSPAATLPPRRSLPEQPLNPELAEILKAQVGAEPEDLALQRTAYEELAARHGGPPAQVALVADEPIGSLRTRRYVPADASPGTIVYFHGGGWTVGSVVSSDVATRAIANAAGVQVISVDYRLAPEHPFPAALEDCLSAIEWVDAHEDGAIAVAGDSAGANLATVVARRRRDAGVPVVAQALAYPVTAEPRPTNSYSAGAGPLGFEEMRELWRIYAGDVDPTDPDVSPLRASLAGMPPTFVALAAHDVLYDDGAQYAAALRDAGVEVEVVDYPDMAHGFLRFGGVVAAAGDLSGRIGAFLGARLTDCDPPHTRGDGSGA